MDDLTTVTVITLPKDCGGERQSIRLFDGVDGRCCLAAQHLGAFGAANVQKRLLGRGSGWWSMHANANRILNWEGVDPG